MLNYKNHKKFNFSAIGESIPCFICGANGNYFLKENGFTIRKCKNCKLLYLSDPPGDLSLKKYYETFYSSADKNNDFLEQGTNLKLFNSVVMKISKYANGSKVLEVGAGAGYLIDNLTTNPESSWDITAIEPDKLAASVIKRKGKASYVHNGGFDSFTCEDESFDVITGVGSFEHIRDNHFLFEKSFKALKPGGIMVFAVPNIEGYLIASKMLPFAGIEFLAPQHFFDYNPKSVSEIATKYGFEIMEIDIAPAIDTSRMKLILNIVKSLSRLLKRYLPQFCLFGGGLTVVFRKPVKSNKIGGYKE